MKDQFGKQLAVNDVVMIDARVIELIDENDDESQHIRVQLTNGPEHTIVLHSTSVAKVVEDDETAEAGEPAKGAPAGTPAAPVDLTKLNKDKLLQYAADELNVILDSTLTKAELIKLIEAEVAKNKT